MHNLLWPAVLAGATAASVPGTTGRVNCAWLNNYFSHKEL